MTTKPNPKRTIYKSREAFIKAHGVKGVTADGLIDMTNQVLIHLDLDLIDLSGIDFTGSFMGNTSMIKSEFTGSIFKDSNLTYCIMIGSRFDNVSFKNATIDRARLDVCHFKTCDLSIFRGFAAIFSEATFDECVIPDDLLDYTKQYEKGFTDTNEHTTAQ